MDISLTLLSLRVSTVTNNAGLTMLTKRALFDIQGYSTFDIQEYNSTEGIT